jgi:MFS family permease
MVRWIKSVFDLLYHCLAFHQPIYSLIIFYRYHKGTVNMQSKTELSFTTLIMMISFAAVNAVLFTPALPDIAHFFSIRNAVAQQTIIWFLISYALGQLVYGPIANRFGRKHALYAGISLQIVSSLLCALSGMVHEYSLLILGRFLLGLGSGVGLKMTFTLVHECYAAKIANQKITYLMLAFAVTPGLAVALGGILNVHYGWTSCFYAGAIYGLILLFFVTRLPETQTVVDYDAFKIKHIFHGYASQFKNTQLIAGGLLMGGVTCFTYAFAAVAPFVAINLLGMNSAEYGVANLLPTLGLILGTLFSAQFAKKYSNKSGIRVGISIAGLSAILMMGAALMHQSSLIILFIPFMLSYFGLTLVYANASTVAMSHVSDKSHGSAVMNFINMGSVTIVVLSLSLFPTTAFLLPAVYIIICTAMMGISKLIFKEKNQLVNQAN